MTMEKFLASIENPMTRGKAKAALEAPFGLEGVRATRAHHIEFLVAFKYTINEDGNLEKEGEPGYYRAKDFGKITMQYAAFLLGN